MLYLVETQFKAKLLALCMEEPGEESRTGNRSSKFSDAFLHAVSISTDQLTLISQIKQL